LFDVEKSSSVCGDQTRHGYLYDGEGIRCAWDAPFGMACDSYGYLYVCDMSALRIVDPVTRRVVTIAGARHQMKDIPVDGIGSVAKFGWLYDVTVAPDNRIFVVDDSHEAE
jgi:hypothetical protein